MLTHAIALIIAGSSSWASPAPSAYTEPFCSSAREFTETMTFLRESTAVTLPENQIRDYADEASKGCTGGARRFKDVFSFLDKMGVDKRQAIKIAITFAADSDKVTNTFLEILKGTYLKEYFDVDFRAALKLAYDLALAGNAPPERLRRDFVGFVRFCKENDGLSLPLPICMGFTRKLLELSPYFQDGAFPPFKELYTEVTAGKHYGLSVKDGLDVSFQVLRYGPKASENFRSGYDYALSSDGLHFTAKDSLRFALTMAERSIQSFPPPVVEEEPTAAAVKGLAR